jgi:hypothetical protein
LIISNAESSGRYINLLSSNENELFKAGISERELVCSRPVMVAYNLGI